MLYLADNGYSKVFYNGIDIFKFYPQDKIESRNKLGLPEIKTAPIDEIKTLLKETNFDKNITKGE